MENLSLKPILLALFIGVIANGVLANPLNNKNISLSKGIKRNLDLNEYFYWFDDPHVSRCNKKKPRVITPDNIEFDFLDNGDIYVLNEDDDYLEFR